MSLKNKIRRALGATAIVAAAGAMPAVVVSETASAATCRVDWVPGYYGHQAYGFCYGSTTKSWYRIIEVGYNGVQSRGNLVPPGATSVGPYRSDSLKYAYLRFGY